MLKFSAILALALLGGFAMPGAAGPLDRPAPMSAVAQQGALLSVSRVGQRLVSVGERGRILLSDDAGASWRQVPVPASTTLTAVAFADARVGVAVGHGGVILRTQDTGETWARIADGRAIAQQIAARAGQAGTRSEVTASSEVEAGPDKPLLDVRFSDSRNGLAVGADGLILSTSDGGLTWTAHADGVPAVEKRHLYAAVHTQDGWYVAGEQGVLYRFADGGRSFGRLQSPYRGSYFGILAGPGGAIVAFGLRGNAWRSDDQGQTWKRVAIPTHASLIGGAVQDNGSVLLFDEVGGLWISDDEGRHFLPGQSEHGFPITSAVQTAPGRLLAVGPRGMVRLSMNPSHQEDKTHVH